MALQVDLGKYQAPSQVGGIRLGAARVASPSQPANPSAGLNLSGIGRPQSGGITNQNLLPANLRTQMPTSPATQKPLTGFSSAPRATSPTPAAVAEIGKYNEFAITPGTDAEIAEQIRRIDAGRPVVTERGSIVSADMNGNISSPSAFKIDLSGPVKSSSLGSSLSGSDVRGARKSYEEYVLGLSEAMQYSPEYLNALEAAQDAKLRGAELKSNFYTGNNLPGDTVGFAEGFTNRETALNDIRGLAAQQALQVQELVRSGNIEAAKALVTATTPQNVSAGTSLVSPFGEVAYGGVGAYSDYQAQQTYFNLAQSFPDAMIPAYNPNLTAQQNLQAAQGLAAESPSFQSRNLVQVQLPGGGISFVNRNQLTTGADGTVSIVSPQDAVQANAANSTIADLTKQRANMVSAISAANASIPPILQAAREAGVNNNAPLINEIEQKIANRASKSEALAKLNTLIPSLQTEYSRIIARGGSTTVDERATAQALISRNYSLGQLSAVFNVIRNEGQSVIDGYDKAIAEQQGVLQGIYSNSNPLMGGNNSPSGGGLTWDSI